MNEIDKLRVQKAFAALAEMFDKPISITQQRLYLFALKDLRTEGIEEACRIALSECKFFPKPAELRELVKRPEDDPDYRAQLAWQKVKKIAVGRVVHTGRPIDFQDPCTNAAVRAVGGLDYLALQGTDAEHERYTRPRFIEAYKNHAKLQYLSPSQTAPLRSRVTNRDDPILIPCEYEVAPRIEHTSDSILNRLADKVSIKKNPKSEN